MFYKLRKLALVLVLTSFITCNLQCIFNDAQLAYAYVENVQIQENTFKDELHNMELTFRLKLTLQDAVNTLYTGELYADRDDDDRDDDDDKDDDDDRYDYDDDRDDDRDDDDD